MTSCDRGSNADDSTADTADSAVTETVETVELPAETAPDEPSPTPETLGTPINPSQAAVLNAQDSGAQINLRSQPTTQSTAKGYGLVGDAIELLRAAEGEDNLTWYYVKFDQSGAEGWIRGDFISTSGSTANRPAGSSASIEAFTTDELFAMGSGGCGMTLWPVDAPGDFIFFNGLPDTSMWMKIDGTMTEFRRTDASGPGFYGQLASQTFVSNNGAIEVRVRANAGTEEGYESINVEQGELILEDAGGETQVTVVGDAGC
ncbi:MAG: SH3 domain-containing protein [Leptolyngbyaceae cyanobacterium]